MDTKFCKLLNNAVSFKVNGTTQLLTFNPCCLYTDNITFHPTLYKKHRDQFTQATTFLPGCNKCELKEKTNQQSLRNISNQTIPDNLDNSIYKLEISIDTTCNAACIQCDPKQSSLWRKETGVKNHIQLSDQIESKILKIKSSVDFSKLKILHFWGGEPLSTDTHLKFLNDIENKNEVSLLYTTNGSIFPNEYILSTWEKFKEVKLIISLDGIEDRFNYFRWPLKWEKIKKNIIDFKVNVPNNIRYLINFCVTPLNAYYVDELENWLEGNFNTNKDGSKILCNYIKGDGNLDMSKTPIELRNKIFDKLSESHEISRVFKNLPYVDYKDMINYLDYWDNHRNLNWRQTFKEVAKYFN